MTVLEIVFFFVTTLYSDIIVTDPSLPSESILSITKNSYTKFRKNIILPAAVLYHYYVDRIGNLILKSDFYCNNISIALKILNYHQNNILQ